MTNQKIFNLNFDDVHPEGSKHIADCGGDMEKGVFRYILQLLEEFPKLKITLFVTPNWIDKPNDPLMIKQIKKLLGVKYTNEWEEEPFNLDKHREWCGWLNELVKKNKSEVAIHGLYHHRDSDPHSAEFKDLPYHECKRRLILAENVFGEVGLIYTKGFRPPGWGISEGLFKALNELNYLYVSCDPIACSISIRDLPRYKLSIYKGMINIPQDWDIRRGTVKQGIEIITKYGFLSAKGHVQEKYGNDYTMNGLTKESYENIRNLLIKLEKYDIKYLTMKEIAEQIKNL